MNTDWLNKEEYPFMPHYFRTPAGCMHYVDEGTGDPIVLVHGNPSWSFQFRNIIKGISEHYRCIAPDHIGFGLSDKPPAWPYLPKDHAENLEGLLEYLDLKDITLVVGDWGGPIGLSYAIRHPENVRSIVITNTWLWSVKHDWYYQAFSRFTGGPVGRLLVWKRNFFVRDIMRSIFGDRRKLTAEIHKHYISPLAVPEERKGTWVFPREIIGSSDWLGSLWNRADVLKDKNILIAWGMKDIAFRKKELERWTGKFSHARVVRFSDAGHFLSEEKATELITEIRTLNGQQVLDRTERTG